jgi:hypothetical protein
MTTSTQSTFDILQNSILSKPRMMGSPAEKETTRFILDFLTRHGLNPFTEEFEWSTSSRNGRKYLFLLVGFFLILLNISLVLTPPLTGFLSIALILFSIACIVYFGKGLINHRFKFFGESFAGKNVVCDIGPVEEKNNAPIIYLTAHTDSLASNFPSFYMKLLVGAILGALLVVLLALVSAVISLLAHYGAWSDESITPVLNMIILIVSLLVLIFVVSSLFSKPVNTSPGACDNGSGSAILLSLASHFGNNPLQNARLRFLWFAAEEWGLFGSKEYVAAHEDEITAQKGRSYVINVDMVGTELAYLEKAGLIRKKPFSPRLNAIIAQIAEEAGIEARPFNSVISGNSDHAPFKKEDVEVCFFLARNDVSRIHSPKDTIEHVNPEKLADAVTVIKGVVTELDNMG